MAEPGASRQAQQRENHIFFFLLLSKAEGVERVLERKRTRRGKGLSSITCWDVVGWFYFLNPGCAGRSPSSSKPHEISKGSGSF